MKRKWGYNLALIFLTFLAGCGNKEVIVPVNVVDHTAPIIKVKAKVFYEGDSVIADDLAEAVDNSDVTLCLLSNPGEMKMEYEILQPGSKVILKAEDEFGNETITEIVPKVLSKERSLFPAERSFEWLDDFPYGNMNYADDDIYKSIQNAYDHIEWQSNFKPGDTAQYPFYKEKYKLLLDGEVKFLKVEKYTYSEVNEQMYLYKFLGIGKDYAPDDLFDGEDNQYGLYFFDMDSDEVPELCITEKAAGACIRSCHIFKYKKDADEIVLWKTLTGSNTHIMGSGIIGGDWEDQYFVFNKLNQSGEEDISVFFVRDFFHSPDEAEYMVSIPVYKEMAQHVEITDKMKQQGYFDESEGFLFFCVTKEQYQELTNDYFASYEAARENIETVSYTYKELFGQEE